MKQRIPRKAKKWHRKHGYVLHFTEIGQAYFVRCAGPFWVGVYR